LAALALSLAAGTRNVGAGIKQEIQSKLISHRNYVSTVGADLPEIIDWKWLVHPTSRL